MVGVTKVRVATVSVAIVSVAIAGTHLRTNRVEVARDDVWQLVAPALRRWDARSTQRGSALGAQRVVQPVRGAVCTDAHARLVPQVAEEVTRLSLARALLRVEDDQREPQRGGL